MSCPYGQSRPLFFKTALIYTNSQHNKVMNIGIDPISKLKTNWHSCLYIKASLGVGERCDV
jgi:hypothetical protein